MAYLSIIIIHSSLYLCGQQSMRLPRRFAPRNDKIIKAPRNDGIEKVFVFVF